MLIPSVHRSQSLAFLEVSLRVQRLREPSPAANISCVDGALLAAATKPVPGSRRLTERVSATLQLHPHAAVPAGLPVHVSGRSLPDPCKWSHPFHLKTALACAP